MSGEATKALSNEVLWGGGRSPFSVSYGKMMMWFFLVSDALTFSGLLVGYGFIRHSMPIGMEWPMGESVFRALPFYHGDAPLIYVAFMTAVLIFSSVTMVLAVEAGHRMAKKGVIKWLFWTVIGGATFVGSQVWEWGHFIHGSGGYITMENGDKYWVQTDGHGASEHHDATAAGHDEHGGGGGQEAHGAAVAEEEHDAHDPSLDPSFRLALADTGGRYLKTMADPLSHEESVKLFNEKVSYTHGALAPWSRQGIIENEYGPPQYANFFFFITGFHGFHVFSGVIINLIVLLMVARGVFHRRGHYEMVEKAGLYWHFVDLVWVFVFTFFYLV
jgi:cytochrome c oxidase subunit III